jgi:nucleoside-diphosphate-sugar epimerase
MDQSILIPDSAGFLGAHLTRALALKNEQVVVYDNFLEELICRGTSDNEEVGR